MNKAFFLDRDGVINKDTGYIKSVDELEILPRVPEAINLINQAGYLCIVITNQPVVARGEITEKELYYLHSGLFLMLLEKRASIDGLYFCPHHPDSGFSGEVKELKIDCNCRKPKIGMIEKAKKQHDIDLSKSYFVGDSWRDIQCAKNAGITSIGLTGGNFYNDKGCFVEPHKTFDSLYSAVINILGV